MGIRSLSVTAPRAKLDFFTFDAIMVSQGSVFARVSIRDIIIDTTHSVGGRVDTYTHHSPTERDTKNPAKYRKIRENQSTREI